MASVHQHIRAARDALAEARQALDARDEPPTKLAVARALSQARIAANQLVQSQIARQAEERDA